MNKLTQPQKLKFNSFCHNQKKKLLQCSMTCFQIHQSRRYLFKLSVNHHMLADQCNTVILPFFLTLYNMKRINRAFIIIVTLCLPVSKTDLINCRSCQLWQEAFSLETRETGGRDCLQPLSINVSVCSNTDGSPQTRRKTLLAKFV